MSAVLHFVKAQKDGGDLDEYIILEQEQVRGGDYARSGFHLCCVVDIAIRGSLDQDQWEHLPVDKPLAAAVVQAQEAVLPGRSCSVEDLVHEAHNWRSVTLSTPPVAGGWRRCTGVTQLDKLKYREVLEDLAASEVFDMASVREEVAFGGIDHTDPEVAAVLRSYCEHGGESTWWDAWHSEEVEDTRREVE